MTKGLRQHGITSIIAIVYSGSQSGANSSEIIESATDLWDAASKSLSLQTRRRMKLLPPIMGNTAADINP